MKLIILAVLFANAFSSPLWQSLLLHDDGSYQFHYETGKEGGSHSRTEVRNPDGVVVGKFAYEDPTGEVREVSYRADDLGYVAYGDVSVKGAPKGQFPVVSDQNDEYPPSAAPYDDPSVKAENSQPQEQEHAETVEPQLEDKNNEDIKDLPLEESASNEAPPEAFPEGFFLQKFQGLRRLPEPTKEDKLKEDKPTTIQPDVNEAIETEQESKSQPKSKVVEDAAKVQDKAILEMELFKKLRPFPSFAHEQWAPAMFRQPVYVYSYQQPESYGYHYFF